MSLAPINSGTTRVQDARRWVKRGSEVLPELGRAMVALGHPEAVPQVIELATALAALEGRLARLEEACGHG